MAFALIQVEQFRRAQSRRHRGSRDGHRIQPPRRQPGPQVLWQEVLQVRRHVRAEGERKLTDMNYNMKIRIPTGDQEFRPDKEMLSDWMRSELKHK